MNEQNIGVQMHEWAKDLFPICRSLTGEGVRSTLNYIKKLLPDLQIFSVPSGTQAFDWKVPDEWTIRDGYVLDESGARIIDFKANNLHVVASARAGNVIGGGDWAEHRIVPDCIKAWSANKLVELRNPHSTRPWQHVLEPLSGYLTLAMALTQRPELHGQPFNFGPKAQQNHSVLALVQQMSLHWNQVRWQDVSGLATGPYESGLLKLNCDKALHYLQWHAVMGFEDTVRMTAEWYRAYYDQPAQIAALTCQQLHYS